MKRGAIIQGELRLACSISAISHAIASWFNCCIVEATRPRGELIGSGEGP